MKNALKTFLGALLAGICIGIGGTVFLSLDNKVVGAVMFSVGLYAICAHGLNLYTGKVGYIPEQPVSYLVTLAEIWLGNFAGALLAGGGMRLTSFASVAEKAASMCTSKLNDNMLSLFLLGIFCGLLMFIAVDGYKRTQNPLILFACVAAFILCGFEHCIADMYYFAVAGMITLRSVFVLIVITLGNSVGGVLIPLWRKLQA